VVILARHVHCLGRVSKLVQGSPFFVAEAQWLWDDFPAENLRSYGEPRFMRVLDARDSK
jgi:hypothetical protein